MVGAAQGVLEVAENCIHPSKLGALDSGLSAAHHHRLMNAARRGDAMKAGQPIGDDPSACTEVELRPGGDFDETGWNSAARHWYIALRLLGGANAALVERHHFVRRPRGADREVCTLSGAENLAHFQAAIEELTGVRLRP